MHFYMYAMATAGMSSGTNKVVCLMIYLNWNKLGEDINQNDVRLLNPDMSFTVILTNRSLSVK